MDTDSTLLDTLLHAFRDIEFLGIVKQYDEGKSRATVLAANFRQRVSVEKQTTYVVKIGLSDWATKEQAFYSHHTLEALTPLLARIIESSDTVDGMTAVAYDLAFSSVLRPQPLASLLQEGATDRFVIRQIQRLTQTLVDWYLAAEAVTKAEPVDMHAQLCRMLGPRRMRDIREVLSTNLPFWKQNTLYINVDDSTTRLPNPIAYLDETNWQTVTYRPPCPISCIHGDLHSGNIICLPGATLDPRLIDFGESTFDGVPFFDLAYLEFDIMQRTLPLEPLAERKHWFTLLNFTMTSIRPRQRIRHWRAGRTWSLIRPIRDQVARLVLQSTPESYREGAECVWWLSTVAVGLNFARKGTSTRPVGERLSGMFYAAYGLRQLHRLLGIHDLAQTEIPVIPWMTSPPLSPSTYGPSSAVGSHVGHVSSGNSGAASGNEIADEVWIRGKWLGSQGHLEEALLAFEHAVVLAPNERLYCLSKANALAALQRYDEAIAAFDRAISLDPEFVQAWNAKANALAALQRYDEAIAAFDRAISFDLEFVQAANDKGRLLKRLSRVKNAEGRIVQ